MSMIFEGLLRGLPRLKARADRNAAFGWLPALGL